MSSAESLADPPESPSSIRRDEVLAVVNSGRSRRRWGRLALGLGMAGILAAAGLYWQRQGSAEPTIRFVTVPAKVGSLRETVTATGTLSPVDAVELGAEVTGRLTRVLVDVNDRVEAGQVLAEIDPEQLSARVQDARAQLGSAQAGFQSAKATLAEAELKAARMRALGEKGLASKDEVETMEATLARAKASVATATAQVTVARAGLASSETSLQKAIIRAPIAGVVLMRAVEPGQTVTAGFQTPVLFTLARDLTQLELNVEVDEADIGKVKQGQSASFVVDAYPDRVFRSKLVQLHNMPKAEATVVTYPAVLTVDNSDLLLRPGMTATATIVTRELDQQLLVENRALRFEPPAPKVERSGRSFLPLPGLRGGSRGARPSSSSQAADARPARSSDRVFIQKAPGQAERVPVKVLASDGSQSAVESPRLKKGTPIIVDVETGSDS